MYLWIFYWHNARAFCYLMSEKMALWERTMRLLSRYSESSQCRPVDTCGIEDSIRFVISRQFVYGYREKALKFWKPGKGEEWTAHRNCRNMVRGIAECRHCQVYGGMTRNTSGKVWKIYSRCSAIRLQTTEQECGWNDGVHRRGIVRQAFTVILTTPRSSAP